MSLVTPFFFYQQILWENPDYPFENTVLIRRLSGMCAVIIETAARVERVRMSFAQCLADSPELFLLHSEKPSFRLQQDKLDAYHQHDNRHRAAEPPHLSEPCKQETDNKLR